MATGISVVRKEIAFGQTDPMDAFLERYLEADWRMDGEGYSVRDYSGRGHTGFLTNGAKAGQTRFGRSVATDGGNDHVDIATANQVALPDDTPWTIEFFVQRSVANPVNNFPGIAGNTYTGGYYSRLYWDRTSSRWRLANDANSIVTLWSAAAADLGSGEFAHFAVTADGSNSSNMRMYKNGAAVGAGSSTQYVWDGNMLGIRVYKGIALNETHLYHRKNVVFRNEPPITLYYSGGDLSAGYGFYTSVDIQAAAVGANETDYPVALVVTDNRFRTTGNGGNIQNTDATGGASGGVTVPADFVVSPNSDGSSPYDFEIVDYDATTGYIELWVEVTSVSSSSDTTIYLVYGDAAVGSSQEDVEGTWDGSYLGVWHMGEPSGTIYDSTATGEDSASETLLDYANTGAIGDCPEFDEDDNVTFSDNASFDFEVGEGYTVAFWTNNADAGNATYVNKGSATANDGWSIRHISGGSVEHILEDSGIRSCSSDSVSDGSWHYVVARRSTAGNIKIRVDDANEGAAASNNVDLETAQALKFGMRNDSNADLDGYLDEVMISNAERDNDYIGTAFINQGDPTPSSTFWSALGTESSPGAGGTVPIMMHHYRTMRQQAR
jgi:hypothetical protein